MSTKISNGLALTGVSLVLVASVLTTSANAQMTSEEIYRRLQIQQQQPQQPSGMVIYGDDQPRFRGLKLDYGTEAEPLEAAPETPPSSGVTAYQAPIYQDSGAQMAAPEQMISTGVYAYQPDGTLEPVAQGQIATAPMQYGTTVAPTTVTLDTYQPIMEEARIDLNVTFEWNSAQLRPEALNQLGELCSALQQVTGGNVIKLIGHTDKSGTADYNLYLSRARAREVKRHLVSQCGIPQDSLLATGEGERRSNPGAPQRDPSERRVEVQLVS